MRKDASERRKKTKKVLTEEEIRQELAKIVDPHTGVNIIEMGLVPKIEINEGMKRVYVVFRPTSPLCPITRFFETRIRDVIEAFGYDPEVEVVLE